MHIIVFGDSITQGYDDYEKGGWVNRLFIDVSARQDKNNKDYISVFNQGIDGNTTVDLLERIEAEINARKDNNMIVIFDVGGNDAARRDQGESVVPFNLFSKNYSQLIEIAKKYGRVVCLGLHESDGVFEDVDAQTYDSEIRRLAEANSAVYISMADMLSRDFDGLTYDGDHPSPAGHQLIYDRLKEGLKTAGIF